MLCFDVDLSGIVVQIKCRPTETSFWSIKFSTLKFAKRNQIHDWKFEEQILNNKIEIPII